VDGVKKFILEFVETDVGAWVGMCFGLGVAFIMGVFALCVPALLGVSL
jgi:hypothetical protein